MKNFDVGLAIRLALDSKKAEKLDSTVLYAEKAGVSKNKLSFKLLSSGKINIK